MFFFSFSLYLHGFAKLKSWKFYTLKQNCSILILLEIEETSESWHLVFIFWFKAMSWEMVYTNNLTTWAVKWLLCDYASWCDVSDLSELLFRCREVCQLIQSGISGSCKQATADIVYSFLIIPQVAVDVACHRRDRMHAGVVVPDFHSSCQSWPGLTMRGRANWILNTSSFCLSLPFISTAPVYNTFPPGITSHPDL